MPDARDMPSDSAVAPVSVELRAARIPVIGFCAWHHWFVVERAGGRDRWEVWQRARVGGIPTGHLHQNLMAPDRGVGNGPSWVIHRWSDDDLAHELATRIEATPWTYPWCDRYLPLPGPNSNTYVQWVLRGHYQLGRNAPGWRYALRAVAIAT